MMRDGIGNNNVIKFYKPILYTHWRKFCFRAENTKHGIQF